MDKYFCIEESESFGRYLVATRDISESTQILEEPTLICAPADECEEEGNGNNGKISVIFCLSCCIHLKTLEICDRCGWPLCKKCAKNKVGSIIFIN